MSTKSQTKRNGQQPESNMEFEDPYDTIWNRLKSEYQYSRFMWWNTFIASLDLGITHLGYRRYKIIDEKKWTLNKIKYGI